MNPNIDPTLPFQSKLQSWYDFLDKMIAAEEKDKAAKDYSAWAADVNKTVIEPIIALFKEKGALDFKIQTLDANPKVKKDDHLKRLKALRYNIYTFQRKEYLENTGDL